MVINHQKYFIDNKNIKAVIKYLKLDKIYNWKIEDIILSSSINSLTTKNAVLCIWGKISLLDTDKKINMFDIDEPEVSKTCIFNFIKILKKCQKRIKFAWLI